uniref:Metalloprotease TIKI homolog n=2 Tax=Caenorhabditis tropicalis TaxID=1561998 RepID=A0A1I7TMZ6_9PELO
MIYRVFIAFILLQGVYCQCDNQNDKNIFLWSVKHPQLLSQGYLFGTIHVPVTEVWKEVSDRVREAFYSSDTVLLEIDLHDEATIHELISCKNLAYDETVHSYLPTELFKKIEKIMEHLRTSFLTWAQGQNPRDTRKIKHAEEIHSNITGDWWRKRPIWLLFLLYQLCENVFEKASSPLLDLYIAQKATDEKKTIIPIETAEEQCNPVWSVSNEEIVFAIEHTIHFLEDKFKQLNQTDSKSSLKELIKHYKCGTLKEDIFDKGGMSIIDYATETTEKFRADEINKKLKQDIFIKRNIRMAKRIDSILKSRNNNTIFSAIGAGHFLGTTVCSLIWRQMVTLWRK